jgi:hypothetical protein
MVGKPERKKRMWEDNIKLDIGWGKMNRTDTDQWNALVNTVMNLRVPYNFGKFLSSEVTAAAREKLSCVKRIT